MKKINYLPASWNIVNPAAMYWSKFTLFLTDRITLVKYCLQILR